MKTTLIFVCMSFAASESSNYLNHPIGKYAIKSSSSSSVLPSGMAQVKFEFKFNSGCETNEVKLTVDGLAVQKTANPKNPRMNHMVKKGKHVFKLTTPCDTVVTQTLDMKEKTSTLIDVEF